MRIPAYVLLLVGASASTAAGAVAKITYLVPPGQPAAAFPPPNRPVSAVVSSRWSTEPARNDSGEAATVLGGIAPLDGLTIADIGAGDGYYEARLAQAVGPRGRVIAEDIDPATLAKLAKRVATDPNVTIALGEPHDPRLAPDSIDIALMVHMYHEITQPYALLWNLRASLKPRGRIAIVDADRPTSRHGTPPALLKCELAAVGYVERSTRPVDAGVYLAVFEKVTAPATITPCR